MNAVKRYQIAPMSLRHWKLRKDQEDQENFQIKLPYACMHAYLDLQEGLAEKGAMMHICILQHCLHKHDLHGRVITNKIYM